MSGTCKDCKWCGASRHESHEPEINQDGARECGCPDIFDGANYSGKGEAEVWNGRTTNLVTVTPDMAYSMDWEGFRSALIAGPDFGCVHFEEKPADG